MIAVIQRKATGKRMSCAMSKRKCFGRLTERHQGGAMRDCAQCQAGLAASRDEFFQLHLEISVATFDFPGLGFVRRGQALDGVGDPAMGERQPVIHRNRFAVAGQAKFVQGLVQQNAGVIAREWPAGAVGAVQSRREADDQQPGCRITERRDWPGMIIGMGSAHGI